MLRTLVRDELRQRAEEGCDVGGLISAFDEAANDPDRLCDIFDQLAGLQPRAGLPFDEPSDLAGIRAARPTIATPTGPPPDIDEAVADRIRGGWYGRCAGLVLGKPLEAAPFVNERGAVRKYLEVAGAYPLNDYVPYDARACAAVGRTDLPWPDSHRGNVRFVESDDDIRYTIAGLEILEQKGAAFTTADVAHWWTHRLPVADCFTAEEAAYRNLILLGAHHDPHKLDPAGFEQVRMWMNPYREWIGAQIRADGWALACPGNPELAAEFAWRDASLSHVKNGIYGEMFCAAMIASAAVLDDPLQIVHAGLAQIPEQSRLSLAIHQTIDRCATAGFRADRFEEVLAWLAEAFADYHWVHTINNAAAVVAAFLLGAPDFGKVISIAVTCGWDTDCNGATAGCLCGTMLRAERLPGKWIHPLHDTLMSDIPGFHPIAISACARRHVAVARSVRNAYRS